MEAPPHIAQLVQAFLDYGERQDSATRFFPLGSRVIAQGAPSDFCYLIKAGALAILETRDGSPGEVQVATRGANSIVGESAVLERNSRRRSSAVVCSEPGAELIALSRDDFQALAAKSADLQGAASALRQLLSSRSYESEEVLTGEVAVSSELMSAVLGDIHNFSFLSELVWDVAIDSFLFNFVEAADERAREHGGYFEDQGDGFRVLFQGPRHAQRAVSFAVAVVDHFCSLRDRKAIDYSSFNEIGLGLGVCTDFMSVRRRLTSAQQKSRVLSHSLNVAAAMSKYRRSTHETEIYVDTLTAALTEGGMTAYGAVQDILLEKIGRRQSVQRVKRAPKERVFVSYSWVDTQFVLDLVDRLAKDGVEVWIDRRQIPVGDSFNEVVSEAIQSHRLFVTVFSSAALQSDCVNRELRELLHLSVTRNKVLLPVLLEGVTESQLPSQVQLLKHVRIDGKSKAAYSELLTSIREHTARLARKPH